MFLASRNMNEENSKYHFTREELRGLPDSFFSGREMEGDKYVVTLKYPDYVPVQVRQVLIHFLLVLRNTVKSRKRERS